MDKKASVKETGIKDPVFDADKLDKEYLWMTNTLNRGGLKGPTQLADSLTVGCDSGYLLIEELLPFMTKSLSNCFDSNLAKDNMSDIHKNSKKTGRKPSRRRKGTGRPGKGQKLQGDKK